MIMKDLQKKEDGISYKKIQKNRFLINFKSASEEESEFEVEDDEEDEEDSESSYDDEDDLDEEEEDSESGDDGNIFNKRRSKRRRNELG